jgi:hypothetical protein
MFMQITYDINSGSGPELNTGGGVDEVSWGRQEKITSNLEEGNECEIRHV